MPRSEIDRISKERVHLFGQDNEVKVFNAKCAKGKITGIAFDFDDLLTTFVKVTSDESAFSFHDGMLRLFMQVREKHPNTVLFTSASNNWVQRMARFHKKQEYFQDIKIFELGSAMIRSRSLQLAKEEVLEVKIPLLVNCNVIVDNAVESGFPYPSIFGYTAVQVRPIKGPERAVYAKQAFTFLGIL